MKTVAIIATLSRKEQRQFEQGILQTHKRSSLKKLYYCLKKQPDIEKEVAFKKVFGQPYRVQQDTLFRNELRLLNKELEAFLTELQWQKEQSEQPHKNEQLLVKAYLQRQQYALFEQAWRKLYKRAEDQALYRLQAELLEDYFFYQMQTQVGQYESFEAVKPQLEEALLAHEAYALERRLQLEALHGFVQHNLYSISSGQYPRQRYQPALQQEHPLPNDPLLRLLDAAVQMYFVLGEPKITLLSEALSHAQTLQDHPRYDAALVTKMQCTLALEYSLSHQYQKAHETYQVVIKQPELIAPRNKASIFYNYLYNLINLEHYEEVLEVCHNHQTLFEGHTITTYRVQYLRYWAHLGLGQYEAAHDALLAHDLQERPRFEEFYGRTLLSIVYYLLGDLIMAERETYNLMQNNRYKTIHEHTHFQQLSHIHQFYLLAGQPPHEKQEQKLQALLNDAQQLLAAQPHTISIPLHRWLTRAIQKQLT